MKRRSVVVLCAFVLPIFGIGANAFGSEKKCFDITNNSGAARSDLHLEFGGTGGNAILTVTLNAPGCPGFPPSTVTNPGTPWDINWGVACVDPGEKIQISITSDFPVIFGSGNWTPPGGNVALNPGDVVVAQICVPTLSEWGVVAMALLVVTAATVVLIRRRSAQPA